ncbi:MAG: UDP-glucose--hexose-1-phosphate uridylyltransferase [Clostridia bacterium]|nr:UDP-glucose--hexose-1-phosphate uridylyltransferase [Clostridia bacterium]
MSIQTDIEKLLLLVVQKGILDPMDRAGSRNLLLDLFRLEQPAAEPVALAPTETIPEVLGRLVDAAGERGLVDSSMFELRALFDTRIMGLLMPRPSVVTATFNRLRDQVSSLAATDYFYQLSIDSNYIRMAEIARNKSWQTVTEYGDLEITINLAKPEKDPRAIALALSQKSTQYPRCLLCPENVDYAGRIDFPARQTLRIVPLDLAGERWYLQYSPYVYYNEHCIVLGERHEPMVINRWTFAALLDFVRQFPHYFCGSNADLPIVGGSILNHNHFQGGRAAFPMDQAPCTMAFTHPDFPGVEAYHIHWPLTTLRLSSTDSEALIALADQVLNVWRGYSDPEADIWCESEQAGQLQPHNTITPIARKLTDERFQLDLVLRNNRTTEDFPLGIFHPHPEIHAVKKENIGLIEVMGLAILPGRLQAELAGLRDWLLAGMDHAELVSLDHPLHKHLAWVEALAVRGGLTGAKDPLSMDTALQQEVGRMFKTGLEHCGVFKQDEEGTAALKRFLVSAGFIF